MNYILLEISEINFKLTIKIVATTLKVVLLGESGVVKNMYHK